MPGRVPRVHEKFDAEDAESKIGWHVAAAHPYRAAQAPDAPRLQRGLRGARDEAPRSGCSCASGPRAGNCAPAAAPKNLIVLTR